MVTSAAVYRGDRLSLVSAQGVFEVGDVSGRHPFDAKRLGIGLGKPACELPQILEHDATGVGGIVLVAQVGGHQGGFPWPDRDEAKNLITPILTVLFTRIRHHLDTPEP